MRIGFDELTAWLDFFAHQRGEDGIGGDGVLDLNAQKAANSWIHGRLP